MYNCIALCILKFSGEKYKLKYHKQKVENLRYFVVKVNLYPWLDNFYFYTVLPSSLTIENITPQNRLIGTEGQDLTLSCIAVGGTPAPNVVVIIDGQSVANQTQTAQHIFKTISRSYKYKTVTCQVSNKAYSQDSMTVSVVMYINCK